MAGVRGKPASVAEIEVGPLIREAADLFLKGHNPWGGRVKIEIDLDPQLARRPGRRGTTAPGLA